MADHRDPAHCKYFPLCEPLKTLIGQLSLKGMDTYSGILPREAQSVCSQCDKFERRETLDKTY